MIVPMTKYTFLLHRSDQEKFIEKIGELGIVDITVNPYDPSDEELGLIGNISRYRHTADSLKNLSIDKDIEAAELEMSEAEDIVTLYEKSTDRLEAINNELVKVSKELSDAEPWGDFSKTQIEKLRHNDIRLRFFVTGEKLFKPEWEEEYPIYVVNRERGNVYFIFVERGEEYFSNISEFGNEVREPSESYSEILKTQEKLTTERQELLRTLRSLKGKVETIEEVRNEWENDLQYMRVNNGNNTAAEGSLVIIEGWVPKEKTAGVDAFNENDDIAFSMKEEPTEEDMPPVLLKNNRFARTNEMITRMYSLPKYVEFDPTPLFAPFFILFVGVCLGDLGYGLLLLLISAIARFKVKSPSMKVIMNLVMWCSFASVIAGFITGSFFGINIAQWHMFEPIKQWFVSSDNMFIFSLAIGILQILYAIIIRAVYNIRRSGFKYGLTYIGWAATVISCILAFLFPKLGVEGFSFSSIAFKITITVSLILTVFFSNPDKGFFTNIGLGLYGLYNNVTGLLGDVLSYIRLFALGLSSGIIASSFNALAIGMSPDIPVVKYIVIALILLLGHGINLFMAVIGSFVHPLRLTFVEFYKNIGFEGGGREYSPLSRKVKNN